MACMRISTIFKKWDLLVTLEGKYVCNGFIYTNISRAPRVECTHVVSKLYTQPVFILLASNLYVINLSCARRHVAKILYSCSACAIAHACVCEV